MLIIKAPIETKVKADLCGSYESFTERIRGNYGQIEHYLGSADLLHLVTQPPEIFLMEGGDTMFANETNIENRQIHKVEIVNNLVNRILVSADASLTYQDRVYITNILRQLGIRDDRKFMKEVRKAFQETKNRNELINVYWNNMNELRTMVNEYQENTENRVNEEGDTLHQEILHLHESVNRRLQTGAIYQMLKSFSSTSYNPRTVNAQQYQYSEQSRLSREILLQRLRETVRGEATPLIYRHENIYEGAEAEGEQVTVENVSERITSAVLLNLVDNLYQSSYEYIDHKLDNWYHADQTYYQSAENTLSRIENNTAYLQYLHDESQRHEETVTQERNELSVLNQILDQRSWSDTRIQPSVGGNRYENIRNLTAREGSSFVYQEGDQYLEADMTHITREGDEVSEEVNVTENNEEISRQLYQTYQQNVARNEQYMQNLRQIMEQYRPEEQRSVSREEMQRNALEALEHPEEFLEQIHREGAAEQRQRETLFEAMEEALPPEQRTVNRLIRQYLRSSEEDRERMGITMNNQSLLFYDIVNQLPPEERERYLAEQRGEIPEQEARGLPPGLIQGEEAEAELRETLREVMKTEETVNETYAERRDRELTEQELIHRQRVEAENREIVKELTERVVERWRGERQVRAEEPTPQEVREAVSFIHKSVETSVSEEELEEIRQEINRSRETVQKQLSETQTTETTNYTTVNKTTENIIEQNQEEIQRLINRTIRRQMDTITEKVYGRIERQLSSERKRRGL